MTAPYLTPEEQERESLLSQALPAPTAVPGAVPGAAPTLGAAPQAPGAPPATPTVPPPPPQPPALPGLTKQVGDFASNWMSQGNQYLSPLATATREASEARLGEAEKTASRGIDEWSAQRGLVGSSYEGEQRVDLQGELQRARGEDERAMLQMLADREAMDKAAAGGFGLDTVSALDRQGLERYMAELEGAGLAEGQRQFDVTSGFTQQNIDQRAQQIMNEGRALDLQEARDIASRELGVAALEQGGQQFAANLAQRQTEFASTIGLTREQFETQTAQFQQQFGEQVASRLQQNEQFGRALESDEARNALSVGIQSRALDLQEAGMTMEDAWRQASLDQERELTTKSQELQELGINNDDAVRWATLEQNGDFQAEQVRLEERGYNLQESYQEAEQALQLQALGIDQQRVDLAANEIRQGDRSLDLMEARDQAQLNLAREEMDFQATLQTNEIAQRESEFARNLGQNEQEFVARQDQFAQTMSEQINSRMQQDQQFQLTYQQDDTRMAMENGLRQEALRLQEMGISADVAFQQAQQAFEYGTAEELDADGNVVREASLGYRDRVLQLESTGMENDEAYRYAALLQDSNFRQEAQRLQELGLTMEDAYRSAALTLQEAQLIGRTEDGQETLSARQFREEMDFRMEQADTDKEKFDAMYELWEEYYGKSKSGGDPTISIYTGDGEYDSGDYTDSDVGTDADNPPPDPTGDSDWTWDPDNEAWVDANGDRYVPGRR